MAKPLVNDTIEVDAMGAGVKFEERPAAEAGDTSLWVTPMGRQADNITVMIEPDSLNQAVGISTYITIEHADDKLEVIGYLTVDRREDAERIVAAILSAFPPAEVPADA